MILGGSLLHMAEQLRGLVGEGNRQERRRPHQQQDHRQYEGDRRRALAPAEDSPQPLVNREEQKRQQEPPEDGPHEWLEDSEERVGEKARPRRAQKPGGRTDS